MSKPSSTDWCNRRLTKATSLAGSPIVLRALFISASRNPIAVKLIGAAVGPQDGPAASKLEGQAVLGRRRGDADHNDVAKAQVSRVDLSAVIPHRQTVGILAGPLSSAMKPKRSRSSIKGLPVSSSPRALPENAAEKTPSLAMRWYHVSRSGPSRPFGCPSPKDFFVSGFPGPSFFLGYQYKTAPTTPAITKTGPPYRIRARPLPAMADS